MWSIVVALMLLFILWNVTLIGYRDRNVHPIESDESKVFDERARSITLTRADNTSAILLVHGFPSTPAMYEWTAQALFEAGLDVYAPLLPGFGTDPSYFVTTTFTQWFDSLCSTYERLRGEYETLYVLGTSMGGFMTLKLGERYTSADLAADKLVSIAAPVVYNSLREGIITDYRQYFMRTLALFVPAIGAKIVTGFPTGEDGSADWIGYGGLFLRPGLSLVAAMKQVRRELGKIKTPLLVIHDKGDRTVPFANALIIEREQQSREFIFRSTEMEGDHNRHALLSYHSVQRELIDYILAFLLQEEREDEKA
jgi:carboxylesterase